MAPKHRVMIDGYDVRIWEKSLNIDNKPLFLGADTDQIEEQIVLLINHIENRAIEKVISKLIKEKK